MFFFVFTRASVFIKKFTSFECLENNAVLKLFFTLLHLMFFCLPQLLLANDNNSAEHQQFSNTTTLDKFLGQVAEAFDMSASFTLPGLTDLEDVVLTKVRGATPENLSYSFKHEDRLITLSIIDALTSDKRALLINIPNIGFDDLVPGSSQTPLGAFGRFNNANFIISISVKFILVNIFDKIVRKRFPTLCQKKRTLFSLEPMNLDP